MFPHLEIAVLAWHNYNHSTGGQVGPTASPQFFPVMSHNCGTWNLMDFQDPGRRNRPIFPIHFHLFSVRENKAKAYSWQRDRKRSSGITEKTDLWPDHLQAKSFLSQLAFGFWTLRILGEHEAKASTQQRDRRRGLDVPRRQSFNFIPSKTGPTQETNRHHPWRWLQSSVWAFSSLKRSLHSFS